MTNDGWRKNDRAQISKGNNQTAEFSDSSLEIGSSFGFCHSSFQIVARPKVEPEEHAVADFNFEVAEVGDGFKFPGDAVWHLPCLRRTGVSDFLARQPFPGPAVFEREGVGFTDENGVLPLASGAVG